MSHRHFTEDKVGYISCSQFWKLMQLQWGRNGIYFGRFGNGMNGEDIVAVEAGVQSSRLGATEIEDSSGGWDATETYLRRAGGVMDESRAMSVKGRGSMYTKTDLRLSTVGGVCCPPVNKAGDETRQELNKPFWSSGALAWFRKALPLDCQTK